MMLQTVAVRCWLLLLAVAVGGCCWLLLLAIAVPMQAQELPVVFEDDFVDRRFAWSEGTWDSTGAAITNGMYRLTRSARNGTWYVPMPPQYLDMNADFEIDVRLRWVSGFEKHGYGLSWAGAGINDQNAVIVSPDGHYRLLQYDAGTFKPLSEWTKSSAVGLKSAWNHLVLTQRTDSVELRINGTLVHTFLRPKVFGTKLAFFMNKNMVIEVDRIAIRQIDLPIRLAPDHPTQGVKENLGPGVNAAGSDLSPVITADGRFLYFGRYPDPGNIGDPEKEDIYVCERQADGSWGPARNVGPPLNNAGNNFLISITPDLNTVLLGNTYRSDGSALGAGVSIAYRTTDGWTIPTTVTIDDYYNRNKHSEMCLDPSGQRLILAVERDDSKGEKDLYVSARKADGTFSAPVNILALSTPGNEVSPYMAADGITMYFATNGLQGFGGTDIWMTRRLDDTWLNWSEPENLGPVINSPSWDAYYTVSAKAEYAYLSATNPNGGKADLYRVKLTDGVKPRPLVLVRGRVLDASTKAPIAGLVQYESLTTEGRSGEARSAPTTGSYAITLVAGDLYGFNAVAEGYYPVSDQLSTMELTTYTEIERDLYLVPLRTNEVIRLNNLFFDTGKSDLRPESLPELSRLIGFLAERPTMRIELMGHTDNVGSDRDNEILSQARVDAVRSYLIDHGVDAQRLTATGYGERKPLADNSTEEGRQTNRRVEFRVTSL